MSPELVEHHLKTLAEVVSSVTDDCMRLCIAVKEMSEAGVIPPIPWDLATTILDLHHLSYAAENGSTEISDEKLKESINMLNVRIHRLRGEYRAATQKPELTE